MGDVHRAFDTLLRRDVALKVLHTGSVGEAARARLLREARLGAALAHPNVVTIHDLGEDEGGDAFIVMELVEGRTLRAIMRARGAVDRATRISWLGDIASALEAAHQAGLVHRDIKPDNIIVTPKGTVKVLDFGIARPSDDDRRVDDDAAPPSSSIAGTPAYMAPEQWDGVVDARADQYAWGIVAYELLSGVRPVTVVEGQPARRGVLQALQELGFPPEIDLVIGRATAARAEDRFPTMKALLASWPREGARLDAPFATRVDAPPTARTSPTARAPLDPTLDGDVPEAGGGRGATLVMAGAPAAAESSPSAMAPLSAAAISAESESMATIESVNLSQGALPAQPRRGPRWRAWLVGAAAVVVLSGVGVTLERARRTPRASGTAVANAGSGAPLLSMGGGKGLVRVGRSRSCALMADRTIRCWGGGQARGVTVEGLTGAFEFSVGETHACALASSGSDGTRGDVYCWGNNDWGQLGDGTVDSRPTARKIALPGGPRQFTAISAAPTHTCALGDREAQQELFCWGSNTMGQLGDGTTTPSLVPKRVAFPGTRPGIDDARAQRISLGAELSCAIVKPSNRLHCWGRNDLGQAGLDPTRAPAVMVPTMVPGLPIVNGVFPGRRHSCARDATSRELWCWGANDRGQLGLGRASVWEAPTHVPDVPAIDTMRAGLDHSCAMLASPGSVVHGRCWGSNDHGQLGNGTLGIGADRLGAVDSPAITPSQFDAKLADHACRVDHAGDVWCWGRNDEHQLGDGTGRDSAVPVRAGL